LNNIKILIADDHPMVRAGLKHSLSIEPGFEIIAEASDGEEALRLSLELMPDVAIIDIAMPKMNGIDVTKKIKQTFPQIAVLILTIYSDKEHILGTLESGAAGYLTKNASDADIIRTILAIMNGETVIPSQAIKEILTRSSFAEEELLPISKQITFREDQILRRVAKGQTNKEIAEALELSLRTVKKYLESIFDKLGVSSRTEATVYCLRKGLLKFEDLN
jgi:DNA-binding NarL/FixJ family response regulator